MNCPKCGSDRVYKKRGSKWAIEGTPEIYECLKCNNEFKRSEV